MPEEYVGPIVFVVLFVWFAIQGVMRRER